MWGCGAVYLASLAMDPSAIGGGGLLSLLSPGIESLFVLGASGSVPVFRYGRWWTILSAPWLHGGILHIVLNMMSVSFCGIGVPRWQVRQWTFAAWPAAFPDAACTLALISRVIAIIRRAMAFLGFVSAWKSVELSVCRTWQ